MTSSLSGSTRRRTIRVQDGAGSAHAAALEHLKRGWIPINPRILAEARQMITCSPDRREEFFSLISNDISLCFFLNAELMRQEGASRHRDPAERIAHASTAELMRALPQRTVDVSRHDLRKISPAQSGQLQRTLLAQKTARLVAERAGMPADDAEVGAIFADLGRQLVAWNYPVIFSRAVALQKSGKGDLDIEIERMLGLDPRKISSQLAPQFGLSQELQLALARLSSPNPFNARSEKADFGDIFAYARAFSEHLDSKNFSHREGRFLEFESAMQARAGSLPSVQEIENQMGESLALYEQIVPSSQRLPLTGWQKMIVPPDSNPVTLDALHIRVPDCISSMVSELIRTIEGAGDTVRALSALVERVIPTAGFTSGCIYLLSKDKELLVPQIWIGDNARLFSAVIGIGSGDALAQAVFSSMPVKHTVTLQNGEVVLARYTVGFQSPRVDGVLVLCGAGSGLTPQEERQQQHCFRSIHALLEMILRKDSQLHDPE